MSDARAVAVDEQHGRVVLVRRCDVDVAEPQPVDGDVPLGVGGGGGSLGPGAFDRGHGRGDGWAVVRHVSIMADAGGGATRNPRDRG